MTSCEMPTESEAFGSGPAKCDETYRTVWPALFALCDQQCQLKCWRRGFIHCSTRSTFVSAPRCCVSCVGRSMLHECEAQRSFPYVFSFSSCASTRMFFVRCGVFGDLSRRRHML